MSAPKQSLFTRFAKFTSNITGKPITFIAAVVVVLIWAVTGPIFGFSDTWQLVINTGTTIITFLMVFLIQNTQNRDTTAMQLKLDEIIHALEEAHNEVIEVEELNDNELEEMRQKMLKLAEESKEKAEAIEDYSTEGESKDEDSENL
jgi:low affinity Fe/Cu permease